MSALRDKPLKILGATLAGLALYLQFAFAGWGLLALAAYGQPSDAAGPHALCLAGAAGASQPAVPSDGTSPQGTSPQSGPVTPAHNHLAFCCLWHTPPAIAPVAVPATPPTVYAAIAQSSPGDASLPAGLHRSPANARAPPTLI